MRRALGEMVIQGVDTTLPVQYLLMYNHDFLRGQYDTGFVDKNLSSLFKIYKAAGSINEFCFHLSHKYLHRTALTVQ